MDVLQTVLGVLGAALRAVWPGAAGAALAGYLGWSVLGSAGFLVAAAGGALAGTWIGNRLGLLPVRRLTATRRTDMLLYSTGAFMVVAGSYLLLQAAMIIAAIVAIAVLGLFWLSS